MPTHVTGEMFSVGSECSFVYNDIPRKGVVDKVGCTYVTLKLNDDKDGAAYKSFAFTGIKNLKKS